MELVEVVMQGLRCAPEMARIRFAKGVTLLAAGERERAVVRVVLDQLYPKGGEPTLTDLEQAGAQSRVGVVVQGRDGQLYRLLQDVHTGRRALQKIVGDKAESITASAGEIAQAVTATIGFPQEDVLRELLVSAREDLPSRRAASPAKAEAASAAGGKAERPLPPGFEGPAKARAEDKPLPPGFSDEGAPVADRGGRSDDELRQRLRELDVVLRAASGVKELEFEIDGLQKRGFELDARLRPLANVRRGVQQAEVQCARFTTLERLPSDLLGSGERLRRLQAEHAREAQRIDEAKQSLLADAPLLDERGRQRPLDVASRDPFVRLGLAGGTAAVALGFVGAVAWEPLRWVAFADIPAFGAALFGGIRVLSSLEEGESVRRRVERLERERERLDDKLRAEERKVKATLDEHGFKLEQLPDLAEQLRAKEEAAGALQRALAALAAAEKEGDAAALEAEQAELTARIRALEEKLQAAGAGMGSIGDLEAEKAEIEAMLAPPKPVKEAAPKPEPTPAPEATKPQVAEDHGVRLLQLSRDLLLCSLDDVTKLVQARAGQVLGALTDGRLREMRFGPRGETSVVEAAAGETIAFGALPAFDRDVTWLALKVAVIEAVVKRARLPVIFDQSLDFLAEGKAPMLQKMLQFLSTSTQVVSISEAKALAPRAS